MVVHDGIPTEREVIVDRYDTTGGDGCGNVKREPSNDVSIIQLTMTRSIFRGTPHRLMSRMTVTA